MPVSAETIAALTAMPAALERLVDSVPRTHARWKPQSWEGVPGEMFSAVEHVCHLRDIEVDGYQQRIRRALLESRPELPSLDGYALAEQRRYRDADAKQELVAFGAARRATLDRIALLGDSNLARPAVFEGYGPVTVRGLIHLLCSHDQQHLACLQWLLGKIDADLTLG